MRPKSQGESNFCPEIIGKEHGQGDNSNAPIKKLIATPVRFQMRAKACQPQRHGRVFHPSTSLLLIREEVGSFMLTKLCTANPLIFSGNSCLIFIGSQLIDPNLRAGSARRMDEVEPGAA